jgi:glycosyltransferase involved in cell wall biosynthesis
MFPKRNPKAPHAGIFIAEQNKALEKLGASFDYLFIDGYKSKFEYLKSIFSINLYLYKNHQRYDVIHIHYGLTGLFLLFNCFGIRNKTILTLHGSDISETSIKYVQRFIAKKVARKVHSNIVVNADFLDTVSALNPSTHLIPCGVDSDFFTPDDNKPNNFIIFPSTPSRAEKNFPLFLETFENIQRQLPTLNYICLDGMSREDIKQQLQQAKLLLLTSDYEGSPQVVKEALCCALPVVSTPVGDVEQLLKHAENCSVAKNHSADELAELALQVISKTSKAANGPEVINQLGLSNNTITEKILALYQSVSSYE